MRILHLIDSLAPHGAERSLVALAPHLVDRGIEYEVAFLREPATLSEGLRASGVRVHDLRGHDSPAAHVERVTALVEARRFDALHTTLFRSDVAGANTARALGLPWLTTWASTGPRSESRVPATRG